MKFFTRFQILAVFVLLLAAVPIIMTACGPKSPTSPAPTPTPVMPTLSPTVTGTPTNSPTKTLTQTATTTRTITVTFTTTNTLTVTQTPTITQTPSVTVTPTPTHVLSAFVTIGSSAYMDFPLGIQYTSGDFWVVNYSGNSLQQWVTNGSSPVQTITSFNSGTNFAQPRYDAIDSSGYIYVAEYSSGGSVQVFNSSGTYQTQISASPIENPEGVAVNSAGTTLYIACYYGAEVLAYSITAGAPPTYANLFTFGNAANSTGSGVLGTSISNLRVDASGNVWVPDSNNSRIAEYSSSGAYLQQFIVGSGTFTPVDLVFDGSNNLYAVDTSNKEIVEFNSSGTVLATFGSGALLSPYGITTDGAGTFYVTDASNAGVVGFH